MLRKNQKIKLGSVEILILSASNSEKTNNGYCECCTKNISKVKIHYSYLLKALQK